jgi:O-antigen ligase
MTARFFIPALFLFSFCAALMPFQAYQAHSFLLAFLLLAAIVIWAVYNAPMQNIKINAVSLTGFLFWFLALISVLLSEIPLTSFIYFCFFSAMPLTFLLTQCARQKDFFFRVLLASGATIFAALALFSLAQYFFLPGWLHKGLIHWPLADPNSLAALYALAFFASLGVFLTSKNPFVNKAALFLSLLYLVPIFLTGSRGVLIAFGIALAGFCIPARHFIRSKAPALILLSIIAAISFFLCDWLKSDIAKSPLDTVFSGSDPFTQRLAIWRAAFNIARDHLWHGTGIGTFFLYYPAYRNADYSTAGFTAHNDLLQFFSEMGFLAPILIYGLGVSAIFKTIRCTEHLSMSDPRRIFLLLPFFALCGLFVFAHINFPFNILPILMMAGLYLGFWYTQVENIVPSQKQINLSPRFLKTAFIFALGVVAYSFTLLQTSEILVDQARLAVYKNDLKTFANDINLAGRLTGNRNARALTLAASVPLSILEGADGPLLEETEREKIFRQADRLLKAAHQWNPRLASPFYYQARLVKTRREMDQAEGLLKQALMLDPLHEPSRRMLADFLLKKKDKKAALALLKEGIEWPNATSEFLQETAFLALDEGDIATHKHAMDRIAYLRSVKLRQSGEPDGLRETKTLE